jgi:hypothetical protein
MSQRAFQYFTINTTAAPQPLVGTWLTATSIIPLTTDTIIPLTVASTAMFVPKDPFTIQSPTGTSQEQGQVVSVVSSTVMNVRGLSLSHTGGAFGAGAFLSLAININSVFVQALDGNAATLYIGLGPTFVVATGVQMVAKLVTVTAGVQPQYFSSTRSGPANADNLGQLFIAGTAADSYLPSVGVV